MIVRLATCSLMAALLAACGDDAPPPRADSTSGAQSPASASQPAPAVAARRDVCAMVTMAELRAAVGLEAPGQPSRTASADVCTWLGDSAAAIIQVHATAAGFDTARLAFQELYAGTAEDITGFGDRGFFIAGRTSSVPTSTITAQKGETPVSVQVLGGPEDARRQRVEALARIALSRI